MHPSAVTDGWNGISQAQFSQLVSKTDMGRIERLVSENGADAWRRFVKMHGKSLVKESTTTGITTGLGLNFIDLRAPAYMLDPIFSHIRNTTPRWDKVNAGYGVQPTWKAVVAIDAAQQATTAAHAPAADLSRTRTALGGVASLRTNWTYRVTDKMALLRAVIAGDVSTDYVIVADDWLVIGTLH